MRHDKMRLDIQSLQHPQRGNTIGDARCAADANDQAFV
jgi:hypothetical protein